MFLCFGESMNMYGTASQCVVSRTYSNANFFRCLQVFFLSTELCAIAESCRWNGL